MASTAWCLTAGALGLVVASGCSDTFGVEDVVGIWNTESIGGYAVPGTVVYDGTSHDTQYVRWVFYDGEQCTLTQQVDGATQTFDECDYTLDVAEKTMTIVFQFQVWAGTVHGRAMTLTDPRDVVWGLRAQ